MEKHTLKATKRLVTGRKVKSLRHTGQIPANIYGKKVKSLAVSLNEKEFLSLFAKAGETGLVELIIDSEKRPVLIHQVQYHPVTSALLHVDFFQVDLKEKVTTKVPIILIGEAAAVKDKVGVLLTLLSEVEVEALPSDLPDKIEAEVSLLKDVGQTLLISTLTVSDKVKILTPLTQEFVKVAPLVSKEAEKMAAEEAAAAAQAAAVQAVPTTEAPVEAAGEKPEKATAVKPETSKQPQQADK